MQVFTQTHPHESPGQNLLHLCGFQERTGGKPALCTQDFLAGVVCCSDLTDSHQTRTLVEKGRVILILFFARLRSWELGSRFVLVISALGG